MIDRFFTSSYKRPVRVSPYAVAYGQFRQLSMQAQQAQLHAWGVQLTPLTPEERYIRGKIGAAFRLLNHIYTK